MANEDVLRQRWGDIYRDTDEYQSALKRASVDREQLRSRAQDALGNPATAAQGRDLMARSMRPVFRDPTVRGLEAYQRAREDDYISRARERQRLESQRVAPLAAVVGRPSVERDFSQDFPWMKVRDVRPTPGQMVADERKRVETPANPWSLEDDVQAEYARGGRLSPRTIDALGERDMREKSEISAKAKEAEARGMREETNRIRAEQAMRQRIGGAAQSGPELIAVYDRLTPTEKAEILRMAPETQQARLASHPLRAVRLRSSTGGSVQPSGVGTLDFLEGYDRVDDPFMGPIGIPSMNPVGQRPRAELVR
jgi:hypothetical protein